MRTTAYGAYIEGVLTAQGHAGPHRRGSGDLNSKPQIEQSTVQLVPVDGVDCAVGDAIAFDPGMARIELDVTDSINVTVLKHQFLAGWMTLNRPTLTELGAGDFASTAQSAAASFLGDPAGDGHFVAGPKPGILSAKVTGSMPMNGTWADLVGAPSVTLPNDWVELANALATDANPNNPDPGIKKLAPALLPQGSSLVKRISPRLTLARLYRPLHGRHFVALKVTSKSSTARIRLTMTIKVRVIRHGKAHTITRTITVRTGRTVNVSVPSSVVAVKATLLH